VTVDNVGKPRLDLLDAFTAACDAHRRAVSRNLVRAILAPDLVDGDALLDEEDRLWAAMDHARNDFLAAYTQAGGQG
jgi:hypothetical protein